MPGEYDFDKGVAWSRNNMKREIREILDNIYYGELEAGLHQLEKLSDYPVERREAQ